MLITKLAYNDPPPIGPTNAPLPPPTNDRLASLNHLWKLFKTQIQDCSNPPPPNEFRCSVNFDPTKVWIDSKAVIDRTGSLRLSYANSDIVYTDIPLFQSVAVGHLTAQMIEVQTDSSEYVLKPINENFAEVCFQIYSWTGMRPIGLNNKIWYSQPKNLDLEDKDLLRCDVKMYTFNDDITSHKTDRKWTQCLATLKRKGLIQLLDFQNNLIYELNLKHLPSSRVVMAHQSIVGTDTVMLLIPDMGGPKTAYIKFGNVDDFEDWFSAVSAFAKQPVYSTLYRNPKKSLRAKPRLLVTVNSCNVNGNFDLKGCYVDIALNGFIFARTCLNLHDETANWNETFEIPSLEMLTATNGNAADFKIELFLRRRIRDLDLPMNSNILDFSDPILGHSQLIPSEVPCGSDWIPLGKNISILGSANFSRFFVLDPSYYRKIRHWTTHLEFNLATKLTLASPSSTNKLARLFSKLYACQGRQIVWILHLVTLEINDIDMESDTLFRGNSLMTRAIETLLVMQGVPTLKRTIGRFIAKILVNKVPTPELDPARLNSNEDLKSNQLKMREYLSMLWGLIQSEGVPLSFSKIFKHMRMELVKTHVGTSVGTSVNADTDTANTDTANTNTNTTVDTDINTRVDKIMHRTLASFLFLRFYCPALLNPNLFGITDKVLTASQRRFMVLIAKVLQGLANGISFGAKESWLTPMNTFIVDHEEEISIWFKRITFYDPQDPQNAVPVDKPVKELPFETFMGQELTCPYLIDQYATYALLVNEICEAAKGPKFSEIIQTVKLLSDVSVECRKIEAVKTELLIALEGGDEHVDASMNIGSHLVFNMDTLLFGLNNDDLVIMNEVIRKRAASPAERLAKFGLSYLSNLEPGSLRDKPKSNSVKKLTQFLKLSK